MQSVTCIYATINNKNVLLLTAGLIIVSTVFFANII